MWVAATSLAGKCVLGSEMQLKRILLAIGVAIYCGALSLSAGAPPASASSNQVSILQDDNQLQSNPGGTLANLRLLGDQVVKVTCLVGCDRSRSELEKATSRLSSGQFGRVPACQLGHL